MPSNNTDKNIDDNWVYYEVYYGLMEFDNFRRSCNRKEYQREIQASVRSIEVGEDKKVVVLREDINKTLRDINNAWGDVEINDINITTRKGYFTNSGKWVKGSAWVSGWTDCEKNIFTEAIKNGMGKPKITRVNPHV